MRKTEALRTGWRLVTENEPPAKTDVLIASSIGHPCVATRCIIRHHEKPDVLTDMFYVIATRKYRFPMYWKPIDACDTQTLRDAADYAEQMSKETTSEKCAVAFSDIARKIRKAINIEGGASQ